MRKLGEISQKTLIFIRIALFWIFGVLIILPLVSRYQNYPLNLVIAITTISAICLELLRLHHLRKSLLKDLSTRLGTWWAKKQDQTKVETENTIIGIQKILETVSIILVYIILLPLVNVINPILNQVGLLILILFTLVSLLQMKSYSN